MLICKLLHYFDATVTKQSEGESARQTKVEKHDQKAPEDVTFIREKTYTLPITLARGLRIRARTKKRKKRRTEKPEGVPTHSRLEVRKPRFYQQSSAMLTMLAVAAHP